jgi:hypothetical protein
VNAIRKLGWQADSKAILNLEITLIKVYTTCSNVMQLHFLQGVFLGVTGFSQDTQIISLQRITMFYSK